MSGSLPVEAPTVDSVAVKARFPSRFLRRDKTALGSCRRRGEESTVIEGT
jgi:hypothetical protein